jgi:hypothetical protein
MAAAVAVSATLAVGPAFAGESVMWGEEARNGAVRLMKDGVLVDRVPPATARKTERGFYGTPQVFAASAERFAAIVHTSTVIFEESDSVTSAGTNGAISGRFGQPVEVLSGSLPRRGDRGCEGQPVYEHPDAVDVDGDRVAIGLFSDECGPNNGPWDDVIVVVAGGARTTIPAGQQGFIRDIALAGRYVAWLRERDLSSELVVRDLEAGADVLRVTADDVGARGFDELALQDDGTVAFRVSNRNFERIVWAKPGTPGARVLARGQFEGLALAGDRVLYERKRRFTGTLILKSLDGTARRLAFFPERRRRVGHLDLDATRATWATRPMRGYEERPRGPAQIVVREL